VGCPNGPSNNIKCMKNLKKRQTDQPRQTVQEIIDGWIWEFKLVGDNVITTRISPSIAPLMNLTETDKQVVY